MRLPDPGALTMLDQPSNQPQDNSLPAAERHSAAGDQRAIIDDAFSLQNSCNVVEQKMHVLRTRGCRRRPRRADLHVFRASWRKRPLAHICSIEIPQVRRSPAARGVLSFGLE